MTKSKLSYIPTLVFIGAAFALGVTIGHANNRDDNAAPEYGQTGLPKNCRAYVQTAINEYRNKVHTIDEAMNGIERNCGVAGHTWKNLRD